jgi:integrase
MPRPADLTARQVAELKPRPSAYRIAPNLYLDFPAPTRRSWVFRYVSPDTGRASAMGLGSAEFVSVPAAKAKAGELRAAIYHGRDPLTERRGKAVPKRSVTFDEALTRYIAAHRASWRSAEHARQWNISVRGYGASLLDMPVAKIDTTAVLAAVEPNWQTRTATVSRVRGRIEAVLSFAAARGWRAGGDNPARWRHHLDQMLPSVKRLKPVVHHAAIEWQALPEFYAELAGRADADVPALGLRLLALTATRRGETLAATWSELDVAAKVWVIPGNRTKSARPHRVPLGSETLAVLDRLAAVRQTGDLLLPGRLPGRPISATAMLDLIGELRPGCTIHGLRSSFRSWAAAHAVHDLAAEFCLAHVEGSATVRAYLRDDLLPARAEILERWGAFLAGA